MPDPNELNGVSWPAPTSNWTGQDSDGVGWKVEVEADCFSGGDPMVVSLSVDNTEDGKRVDEGALGMLSPGQAREMAASLKFWADYVEHRNNGGAV